MWQFYLDNTLVEQPESFNLITFEKLRSEKYFGFVQRRKGVVKAQGEGQIKFTEEKAVAILTAAKERDGFGAKVLFRAKFQNLPAYEGTINFWNSEFYTNSVVVTFSDTANVLQFIASSSNRYQITTNKFQTLSSSGIIGKTTHTIIDTLNVFKQKRSSAQNFDHPVPFQFSEGSSSANVNPITSFSQVLPLYTNDSEKKTISVKASIIFDTNQDITDFKILLNDFVVEVIELDDFKAIIDQNIILEPNQELTISVETVNNSANVIFTYNVEKTTLSINEIKNNLKDTNVACITSFDFLNQLIGLASGGTMRLESKFLKSIKHDWTNGKNLRGVDSVLNASFDQVYSDMNKFYCLYTNVNNDIVKIEQRKNIITQSSKSIMKRDALIEEVKTPNREFLYSSVKAGFKTWQGSSALSNEEVNAILVYQTDLFGRENVLDLQVDCIGSGILIEEIRQQQFGKVASQQQKQYDDMLVSLIEDDGVESYDISGDVNADCRNLSIRPYQIATNWADVLGGYKKWKFISGVGNYNAVIGGKAQIVIIDTFGNIIGSAFWDLKFIAQLYEYTNIGDVIQWRDTAGKYHKGILQQAEWQQQKEGNMLFIQVMTNENF